MKTKTTDLDFIAQNGLEQFWFRVSVGTQNTTFRLIYRPQNSPITDLDNLEQATLHVLELRGWGVRKRHQYYLTPHSIYEFDQSS